jgi:hypothetical protein
MDQTIASITSTKYFGQDRVNSCPNTCLKNSSWLEFDQVDITLFVRKD